MSAKIFAIIFLEYFVASFRISFTVPTDIGHQITSKFFVALCKKWDAKAVQTTQHRLQPNLYVKRFKVAMNLELSF